MMGWFFNDFLKLLMNMMGRFFNNFLMLLMNMIGMLDDFHGFSKFSMN